MNECGHANSSMPDSDRSKRIMKRDRIYDISTLTLESLPSPFSSPCAFQEDYTSINGIDSPCVRYLTTTVEGPSILKDEPLGKLQEKKPLDLYDIEVGCDDSSTSIYRSMYQLLEDPPATRRYEDKDSDEAIRHSALDSLPSSIAVKKKGLHGDDQGENLQLPSPPSLEDSNIHTTEIDPFQMKKTKKSPRLQIQRSRSRKYYDDVGGTVRQKKAPVKGTTLDHLLNSGSKGHEKDDASVEVSVSNILIIMIIDYLPDKYYLGIPWHRAQQVFLLVSSNGLIKNQGTNKWWKLF